MSDTLDTWFAREILVHEAALMRYFARTWSNHSDLTDLRQDTYIRVYDAARRARPASPKSFLFTTARHLMTDRMRRGKIVSIEAIGDLDALNVLVDEISPERKTTAWQELNCVTLALNRLPPKCREVVWLRKVDELTTQEIADKLGLSVRTVEGQIRKGMRRVTDTLFGKSQDTHPQDDHDHVGDEEEEHGKL